MRIDIQEWKVIWFFFRPYKLQCLGVLAIMLLSGLLETMNLASLYPIINYGLRLDREDFFLRNFEKVSKYVTPNNPFLAACILLIVISVLAIAFKFFYNYSSNKLLTRIVGDTQKKIFDKFIAADYGFYVKNQQGRLIYVGTMGPERTTVAVLYMITLAYNLLNSAFLFGLLMLLSWQATLFIILLGFFYSVVIKKVMRKYINKCAQITVEENQRKNIILNEFITGIKAIKIFLAVDQWKQRYTQAVDRGLANQFRMMVARSFPELFVKFLFYILIASAGIFFSKKSGNEIISLLPVMGTFIVVVNRFLPSLYVIGDAILRFAECVPDIKIVHELCREEFAAEVDGKKDLNRFSDKITFENVWFKYGSMDDYLLKNLSFSLERRRKTAIVGLSGAGKTTIINLLLKLYRPDKGAIKIDEEDILELSNKTYLSIIGYVSQETFIFNASFKENIKFGMENCTDEMIEEAARLANAHDFIVGTQQGYDTVVGDSGVKLSGGQRQRVAIARAMLRNPEIIVLDEATSSLDNISEKKIQKAINNISKHTTVLVIAHRLSTVQNADKIIILERGEIREQGTHEELLKNKKLYYDLHMSKDSVDDELAEEKIG
jgi:ABC-type multidrug transport system fused ATPase/permease subunit